MKYLKGILLLTLATMAVQAAEPKRLLLVTVTSGFVHAAIPIQEKMVRDMAKATGEFTIISTSDSSNFPGAEYKAVIESRNATTNMTDTRLSWEQVLAIGAGRGAGPRGSGRNGPLVFPGWPADATLAQQAMLVTVGQPAIPLTGTVVDARAALAAASLAAPGANVTANIEAKAKALAAAEQALAVARAEALAKIQASPTPLSAAQVRALGAIATPGAAGVAAGGRGGRGGGQTTTAGGMSRAEKEAAVLKEYLSPEALKNYDGVAFLSTVGELPIPDMEGFFKWVSDGHGFVGLHAAGDMLHNTPEYQKMLGGEFTQHGSHSEIAVINMDPKSPITASFKTGTKITEEWYNWRNYDRSQVHELLTMEMHPTTGAPTPTPVMWIKPYGKGRVFYTSLGHRDDTLDPAAEVGDAQFKVRNNPPETAMMVQKSILAGIRWSLGIIETDVTLGNALKKP